MKNLFLAAFLFIFLLTGCTLKKNAAILLSSEPIDPTSFIFENKQPVFTVRQKIYYILLSKKPIKNEKLRLQVLKVELKGPIYKIEPAYGIDINRGEQEHYITDHITLHKAGDYFIRIFSFDDLQYPIAETPFKVEDL